MKRALSILLVLVLCIGMFTITNVSAVSTVDVTMGTASGKVGDTVSVDLTLTSNPGFGTLGINVSYDKTKLQLINVTGKKVFSNGSTSSPYANTGIDSQVGTVPYLIVWQDNVTDTNTTQTGKLATFNFKILDGATIGQNPVTIVVKNCYQADMNMTSVPTTVTNGSVTAACATHTPAVDWTVTKAATCTESGTRVKNCTVCGLPAVTETIPAIGHNYGAWAVVTPATCTVKGTEKRVCANDATHTETRDIPALGHAYGAWTVVTPATCTVAGSEKRVCSHDATHVETRAIAATGHNFGAWTVVTPATCTVKGTEKRVCANDPTHVETRDIPLVPHNVDEWTVTSEATVDAEGTKEGVCTVGGETITATIPKRVVAVATTDSKATVEAVDDISFDGEATLTVSDVTATIPASDKQDINGAIDQIASGKVLVTVYDISLISDGVPVADLGGTVKVKIAIPDSVKDLYENFDVVYIADDGTVTHMNATVEDGFLVFETDHFSNYAIIGTAVETSSNPGTDSSTPSNNDGNPVTGEAATAGLALILLLVAAAGIMVFRKKTNA